MYYKHLKQKLNSKLYCKKKDKEINIKECSNCIYKEYNKKCTMIVQNGTFEKQKCTISAKNRHKMQEMKKKSSKLVKLERNRFSLFTDDLEHCIICEKKKDNLHEVFFGRNRQNSMKYKMVLPLCFEHHREMHDNMILQNEYKKRGQVLFEETYPDLDFIEIFGRSYK